jgi:hypothetical protein
MGRATLRISLKTIAFRFPEGSLERIYLHGKWQLERGRSPSMNFGNHPTPRHAFAAVDTLLGSYFDEIRHQVCSRQDWFWNEAMVEGVMNKVKVPKLPSVYDYLPL